MRHWRRRRARVNLIYRKTFPQGLRPLDEAVRLANASDKAGSAARANTLASESFLLSRGLSGAKVDDLAAACMYAVAPGDTACRIFPVRRSGRWNDRHDLPGMWRDARQRLHRLELGRARARAARRGVPSHQRDHQQLKWQSARPVDGSLLVRGDGRPGDVGRVDPAPEDRGHGLRPSATRRFNRGES